MRAINTIIFTIFLCFNYQAFSQVSQADSSTVLAHELEGMEVQQAINLGYNYSTINATTTSVVHLTRKDFNHGNIYDPWQLIAGRVPGLSITRAGNNPNAPFDIRLRGISTIYGSERPLVVLDGVAGIDINQVDPNDIESITVLKDAAAAAIYGVRAAQGVVIFNTYRGGTEQGLTDITIGSFVGVDNYTLPNIRNLNRIEFIERGGTDFGANTSWIDEATETAYSYAGNASLGGTFGSTQFRASVNWRNNQGIIKGIDNTRLNSRITVGHSAINDRLRLNLTAVANTREFSEKNLEIFKYAMIYNPTAPVYSDENVEQVGPYFQRNLFDFYNPIALRDQQLFGGKRDDLMVSVNGSFDITENLVAFISYTQDRYNSVNNEFYSRKDFQTGGGSPFSNVGGIGEKAQNERLNKVITGTIKYKVTISPTLFINAFAGLEQVNRSNEGFNVRVRQFLFDANTWNNLGAGAIRDGFQTDLNSFKYQDKLNSAFLGFGLNHKDTYFLNASIRSDGYSGFGDNQKTAFSPSISAGVQLANIFDIPDQNSLKLRFSYGVSGGLPARPDLAIGVFENGVKRDLDGDPNTTDDIYIEPNQFHNNNPELKREERVETNIGIDFSFAQNKITGSIDYYDRKINDLLFALITPIGAPSEFDPSQFYTAPAVWANLVDLSSAGVEFMISYNDVQLGQAKWTTSLNYTAYQETVIESLSTENGSGFEFIRYGNRVIGSSLPPVIEHRVGQSFGNIWGPQFIGVDENGNAIYNPLDPSNTPEYSTIGNGLPSAQLGWHNRFVLNKWDLSFLLRGTFGHDVINTFRNFYEHEDPGSNTWNSVVTDKTIRIVSPPVFSDNSVENASYLRLDNLQLAYQFDTSSDWLTKFRIYFAAQNLFAITDYAGVDPEVRWNYNRFGRINDINQNLAPGIEGRSTYFPTRTFLIGVEIGLR